MTRNDTDIAFSRFSLQTTTFLSPLAALQRSTAKLQVQNTKTSSPKLYLPQACLRPLCTEVRLKRIHSSQNHTPRPSHRERRETDLGTTLRPRPHTVKANQTISGRCSPSPLHRRERALPTSATTTGPPSDGAHRGSSASLTHFKCTG